MDVTLAGFVLFLHIAVVIVAFMIAGVLHTALHVLPRARSVAEMRPWAAVTHRLEPVLPILAVGILALGAWLVQLEHDDGVRWSDGWVLTPLFTLILVEGLAGAVLAPRTKVLCDRVAEAPDGAVPDDLRRLTLNPWVWDIAHLATFGFLAVVFIMSAKPAGSVAWLFALAGGLLGIVASRVQLRAATAAAEAAMTAAAALPPQRDGAEAVTWRDAELS